MYYFESSEGRVATSMSIPCAVMFAATYLLHGRLYDFREIDGKVLAARVAFEFELDDSKTGTTVGPTTTLMMNPRTEKT